MAPPPAPGLGAGFVRSRAVRAPASSRQGRAQCRAPYGLRPRHWRLTGRAWRRVRRRYPARTRLSPTAASSQPSPRHPPARSARHRKAPWSPTPPERAPAHRSPRSRFGAQRAGSMSGAVTIDDSTFERGRRYGATCCGALRRWPARQVVIGPLTHVYVYLGIRVSTARWVHAPTAFGAPPYGRPRKAAHDVGGSTGVKRGAHSTSSARRSFGRPASWRRRWSCAGRPSSPSC